MTRVCTLMWHFHNEAGRECVHIEYTEAGRWQLHP